MSASDANVVGVTVSFVGDGVEAALVAAYALRFFAEPVGGAGELLGTLYLDHVVSFRVAG